MIVDAVMDAAKVLRGEMPASSIWSTRCRPTARSTVPAIPRPTSVAKVTGLWDFGEDMGTQLPEGTLQCALVQPEVSHAIIKGIDTSEAEKMPGVFKVVTHKDVKGKNRITGLITFPTNKGDGWDRPILNDEKIFQFGDVVAIVCADTRENAKAAAKMVKVDLEVLPAYMNAPAAMADDAIEIHPGTPNIYYECNLKKGEDTKPIMKKAAHVVEGEYYLQRQPHMPIEADVGFAYIDDQKRVVIHSKSIGIHLHLYMIAPGLGVEPDEIVMVQNPTGATFGYKFSPTLEALVGAPAMATGRPCFLGYDWYQQQTYTGKRSPFWLKIKMAADEDGKLLAMESDWSCDHGPYSEFGDLLTTRGAQFIGAGYDIKNIRGVGRTVCTNHGWGSAFRAYGSPQSFLASESLMDELAKKMGMDPFELRYMNIYRPGATTPTGQTPEVFCFAEMFDLMRPKYQAALCAPRTNPPTRRSAASASPSASTAAVSTVRTPPAPGWNCTRTASVTVGNCLAGPRSGRGQRHADLRPRHAASPRPDTGSDPAQHERHQPGSQLRPFRRQPPERGHRQRHPGGLHPAARTPCARPTAATAATTRWSRRRLPVKYEGSWTTPCTHMDDNMQGNPFCIYMYALFMSEVEVDVTTGKTKVLKMTYVGDNGTITNRLVVDGQVYGGLAQGIGLALSEDFEDLKKHTTLIGSGFPFIKDITDDMETDLCRNSAPRRCRSVQAGVGEGPLTSPARLHHQRHRQRLRRTYQVDSGLSGKGAGGIEVAEEGLRRQRRRGRRVHVTGWD